MQNLHSALYAGLGAFIGIAALSYLQEIWPHWQLLVAPLGATAVLLFAVPDSPFSNPFNVIIGHTLTIVIGAVFVMFVGIYPWSIALATALAISVMMATKTLHPPAGANPILIMVSGAEWASVIEPLFVGALCLVLVSQLIEKAKHTYSKRFTNKI